MLLTIPWFLAIMSGRVDLDGNGNAQYDKADGEARLTKGCSLTRTGVSMKRNVFYSSIAMMITAVGYLIIEIPALIYAADDGPKAPYGSVKLANDELNFSLAGAITCFVLLFAYLIFQVFTADHDRRLREQRKKRIETGELSATHVLQSILNEAKDNPLSMLETPRAPSTRNSRLTRMSFAPINMSPEQKIDRILKMFFKKHSKGETKLDAIHLRSLLESLNETFTDEQLRAFIKKIDTDGDQLIDYGEFKAALTEYAGSDRRQSFVEGTIGGNGSEMVALTVGDGGDSNGAGDGAGAAGGGGGGTVNAGGGGGGDDDDDDDDGSDDSDDEPEMPDDIKEIPSLTSRMRRIKFRAAWQMLLGTFLVVLFSDPMVDCLSEIGTRSGIPAFYVSFVIAPLASNASELVAAYNYAKKKTRGTITISLSTLIGAACMNNTFCLGIFLTLMYAMRIDGQPAIAWDFTSETVAIVFVEFMLFLLTCRKTQPFWTAFVVLSMFPASIALVAILDGAGLH